MSVSTLRRVAWSAFVIGMLLSSAWLFDIGEQRGWLHIGGFALAVMGAVASLILSLLPRKGGEQVANG